MKQFIRERCKFDEFTRILTTGQAADPICGVLFIVNEYMPKDWILFLDGQCSGLITKLISPVPEFRGMAIEKEQGFSNIDNLYSLTGSFFRIQPEGSLIG